MKLFSKRYHPPGTPPGTLVSVEELEWRYGYAAVIALGATIALGMVVWFRRRGWF